MATICMGILHPGDMGSSIAAAAGEGAGAVYWASQGRSPATRQRAERAGLQDVETLSALCGACSLIVSVCPPHAAEDLADAVLGAGFTGMYLDANAISPARAERIAGKVCAAGATFIDGSIIGGPAWNPGTVMYLSGAHSGVVSAVFAGSPLEIVMLNGGPVSASALKMCFASYSKGRAALASAALATAEAMGIREDLERQWSRNGSTMAADTRDALRWVSQKAWRIAGEMDEIADTYAGAGMPEGFHRAAAEVYRRLEEFKDNPEPSPDAVLSTLTRDR